MHAPELRSHVSEHAIQQEAKKITPDQKAAILARMKSPKAPVDARTKAPVATAVSHEAVRKEVNHTVTTGEAPAFPTASIAAAVRATDVVLPQQLEQRVVAITGMYMNGWPATKIAQQLGLDVKLVQAELRKLDAARSIAYTEDPQLAVATVKETIDVVKTTLMAMQEDAHLLGALKRELMVEHQEFEQALADGSLWQDEEEQQEDDALTFKKGKPTKRKRYGMYSMKVDSYTKLREVWGKQVDRVANVLGLLNKNMPQQQGGVSLSQTNITFAGTDLDNFADMFLRGTGNHIAPLAAPATHAEVIETTAEPLQGSTQPIEVQTFE